MLPRLSQEHIVRIGADNQFSQYHSVTIQSNASDLDDDQAVLRCGDCAMRRNDVSNLIANAIRVYSLRRHSHRILSSLQALFLFVVS
jgi:hypothetical protein